MIWNDFHYYSQTLGIQTSTYVLLPDPHVLAQQGGAPLPALYLLHGLSDDHTMWMRNTRIEQYARKYRLAVIMPAVNRSFYTDMAYGANYFTFISKELPQVMESCFPLSHCREGRFAAGLSMGGYGAMKLALRCPERYAAAASFSGCLEMEKAYTPHERNNPEFLKEMDAVYGNEKALVEGEDNLAALAQKLCQTPEKAPRLYVSCGEEDSLLEANNSFIRHFGQPLSIRYETEKGYGHCWDFWDGEIQRVLEWLNVPKAENVW